MLNKHLAAWLVGCLCTIGIAKADEKLEIAQAWVGKYPSEVLVPGKGNLLAQPPIQRVLARILPGSERTSLSSLEAESPVREIGGFIVVNKCRAHNCPSESAVIVIDAKSGHLWVGFFSRKSNGVATRWYGEEDDYSVLPDTVRQDFADRHGK